MKRIVLLCLLVLGSPTLAGAQPADGAFVPLTMGRLTPVSTMSAELGYEIWDDTATTEVHVISINLAAHLVNRRGVGGYMVLPLSHIDVRFGTLDESELAIGNIEAGGLVVKRFGASSLLIHGGVAFGTASDDGVSDFMELAALTRFGDFAQRVQRSAWLRFGLSPMGRAGALFWRADVGIDLALEEDRMVEFSPIFHLSAGGGIDLGSAHLLGEIVNVITDRDDGADDRGSTFAIGTRFVAGNLRPGVGVLIPVDLDAYEDFEFAVLASLAIHAR